MDANLRAWYDKQTDNVPDWDDLLTPAQLQFAAEEHVDKGEVARFIMLSASYAQAAENECNGEPHTKSSDKTNKSENAKHWADTSIRYAREMTKLAVKWGFHHLDFGVGFYPTLQRGESDTTGTVHFPYDGAKWEEDTD